MKNPTLSLTDLVDVILKTGMPKVTKVTQIKSRPDYEPAFDYYKQLREAIIENHRKGGTKKEFQIVAGSVGNPKKEDNYGAAIVGYSKWWGKKDLKWIEPQREIYSKNGIDVIINPELGLDVDGQKYFIKLYLKSDPLSKNRADLILSLLGSVFSIEKKKGIKMAILDVRNSKLFVEPSKKVPVAVVDAELAYVAALWPSI